MSMTAPSTRPDAHGPGSPLLTVEDLRISYGTRDERTDVVHGVTFAVGHGEVVALVGESGSGKSTISQSLVGMLAGNGRVDAGLVRFDGTDVLSLREAGWRRLRGARIGWVPQDPMSSLNPMMRIGPQVIEPLRVHGSLERGNEAKIAVEQIVRTGLTDPEVRARQYPHELSGGMRQRVLIAMATACGPQLLIADEPTSALDVTVQRQILDELSTLVREAGMSMLLVTHDLAVAADRADRVLVLSAGRLVEEGRAEQVLKEPAHEYTRNLVAAVPGRREAPRSLAPLAVGKAVSRDAPVAGPLLAVAGVRKEFPSGRGEPLLALDDAHLIIDRGTTHGLVGESGSGKSTLARIVLRLEHETSGSIVFDGEDIARWRGNALRDLRRRMQVVYQNPFASLEPRFSVARIVEEPLQVFGVGDRRSRRELATTMLERVSLPSSLLERRPRELSGGQRQRVAIARALVLRPELLVCDEPTSALDVSVQAQILDLLAEIQRDFGISMLFISHDLAVVRDIAHTVTVMRSGRVMETGPTSDVFVSPTTAYTEQLLASIPGRFRSTAGAASDIKENEQR